jgi:hypothetical protein
LGTKSTPSLLQLTPKMDPVSALGLAASIIAVLQLTGSLVQPITTSLGPSENDEKELKRLTTSLTGLQTAYRSLEKFLRDNPEDTQTLVTSIMEPLLVCKGVLVELDLRLSKMTFIRRNIIGKKWDKRFNRLVKQLEEAQELFNVIVQADQSCVKMPNCKKRTC